MANKKTKKKKKINFRLIGIVFFICALLYIWYYASQHNQWMELTKENQTLDNERIELEKQLSKKQRDQNVILSDEAIFQKASKDLLMHRARINERNYLPDPREWKPQE